MLKNIKYKNIPFYWIGFGLLFLIYILIVPEKGHGGDLGHWKRWAGFIKMEGFPYIYDYGTVYPTTFPCNYPPVILYILKIFSLLFKDMEAIIEGMKYFKIIPLIFDFLSAGIIFLLVKRNQETNYLPLFLLLSPAFLYNSFIWGQVDSVITFFVAAALIFALRKWLLLSILFFVIALNTKLQAVVFLPIFMLSIFPLITSWKTLGKALVVVIISQLLILLPFLLYGTIEDWYQVQSSLVDQYQNVSLNAFNFWYLLIEGTPMYIKDYTILWFGMTYKTWGLLFFCLLSFFALLPILLKTICYALQKRSADSSFKEMVFLTASLCVLGFFFFNTQMHERYSHPVMLMAFLYGILSKNYWLYGITSLAYLLNLEKTLKHFGLNYDWYIFNNEFIASLFLMALILGIWQLYKKHSLKKDWLTIGEFLNQRRRNTYN